MKTLGEYLNEFVTSFGGDVAIHELVDDKHALFLVLANELEGEAELRSSLSEMGYEIVKANQDNLTLQLQRDMSS